MRTRCPVCATVFRVTSEQLRLKAGKVRCGHCQAVFNAFDELQQDESFVETCIIVPAPVAEPVPEALSEPAPPAGTAESGREAIEDSGDSAVVPEPGTEPLAAAEAPLPEPDDASLSEPAAAPPVPLAEEDFAAEVPADIPAPAAPDAAAVEPEPEPAAAPGDGAAEEATLVAAREAGLVAARELSDTPAYNRWAAGTLAGSGLGGFDGEPARHAVWPFVLAAVLLAVALLAQILFHFRTEVVQRLPGMAALFELAAVDVPLPRNSDLVGIESSDLQSDNARGLFVLQATLKNRAPYAQAWPVLELTLTDTSDTVVSRRVMTAADYLPPGVKADAFPANGEIAVRLWIEARNIGAAGYRLYIFYP